MGLAAESAVAQTWIKGFYVKQYRDSFWDDVFGEEEPYIKVVSGMAVCGKGNRALIKFVEGYRYTFEDRKVTTLGSYSQLTWHRGVPHRWTCTNYRSAWSLNEEFYYYGGRRYVLCVRARASTDSWSSASCGAFVSVLSGPPLSEPELSYVPTPYCSSPAKRNPPPCQRF